MALMNCLWPFEVARLVGTNIMGAGAHRSVVAWREGANVPCRLASVGLCDILDVV